MVLFPDPAEEPVSMTSLDVGYTSAEPKRCYKSTGLSRFVDRGCAPAVLNRRSSTDDPQTARPLPDWRILLRMTGGLGAEKLSDVKG